MKQQIMFEARFPNATFLKRIFDAVKDLVEDVNLLCTEDGIELQSMDSSHVALINVTILPDACTVYTCDEPLVLGLKVSIFSKILKFAESSDSVILTLGKDTAKLQITFESSSGSRSSHLEMNLMDIDTEHMVIPDVEYDSSVKMPSAEFSRLIRDMSTLGETVSLSIKEDEVTFLTKGDMGQANVTLKEDKTSRSEAAWTEIACGKDTQLLLALKYLAHFAKAQSIADQVSIYMSPNIPVYVTYDMGDKGSMGFYLAPKVDE
jgi:proliferating cell nuclear antigen